ncbi:uncharacterized protein LOC114194891 [Vigna unguiculata]|uniref:uncharacterized protein LOC114194891 n=1 Tax=Vigna unguiculata TaxID=3917 RepID=UPI00101674A2|nr:uncharacterized protein LOC114194891 [Vigna unguiculata]
MSVIQKHITRTQPEEGKLEYCCKSGKVMGFLMDASVRRTLIYKFQSEIKEYKVYTIQSFSVSCNGGSYRTTNHTYKINFQFGTKVNMVENVIGMFTGVGTERELEKGGKKTKMNVILIEADGLRLECTLFGKYVDMLNAFLASGEDQHVVIALHYCKVKTFQDKVSIQNSMNCTKIIFNCDGEDATKLKKMMWDSTESPSQPLTQLCPSSKVSLEDDFIKLHPRSSIEESTFVVKATIKHVLDHDDWWYTACICNKAVYPDSKMYKLKLRVIDATDSTTFVVFNRDASAMLKKSCSDILDLQDKVKFHMFVAASICGGDCGNGAGAMVRSVNGEHGCCGGVASFYGVRCGEDGDGCRGWMRLPWLEQASRSRRR